MTTATIQYVSNSSNNWLAVAPEQSIAQQITDKAKELGVKCVSPKHYRHPDRWVVYFNWFVKPEFYEWITKTFNVKNDNRAHASEVIEQSQQEVAKTSMYKARLSRRDLLTVKNAMIVAFGGKENVVAAFESANIKIRGKATLPQCFTIIESHDLFHEVMSVILAEEEAQATKSAQPAEETAEPIDFEPWTEEELSHYTVNQLKELAELDGVRTDFLFYPSGKAKYCKAEMISLLLPVLNKAGLAKHAQ